MIVTSFTFRFAGKIAHTDETTTGFSESFDGRFPSQELGSADVFTGLLEQQFSDIDSFLSSIAPNLFCTAMPLVSGKPVRSYSVHMSGQVAFDDGSSTGFDFELRPETDSIVSDVEIIDNLPGNVGNQALEAIAASALSSILDQAMKSISQDNLRFESCSTSSESSQTSESTSSSTSSSSTSLSSSSSTSETSSSSSGSTNSSSSSSLSSSSSSSISVTSSTESSSSSSNSSSSSSNTLSSESSVL